MSPHPDPDTLAALRARIWALERPSAAAVPVLPLADGIDAALPWGGLPAATVHEVVATDDTGVGFAAVLLGRLAARGPVLWCRRRDAAAGLYPPGLEAFGLRGDSLIVAHGRDRTDVLWAMEEGLRCPALGAVAAEVAGLDLAAGRRLRLAAEAGGVTGILLSPHAGTSAGTTRWRVSAAPSAGTPWNGIGETRWRLALERCRGAPPRAWLVEWRRDERRLAIL